MERTRRQTGRTVAESEEVRLEPRKDTTADCGWKERLDLRWRELGARKDVRDRSELPGYLFL